MKHIKKIIIIMMAGTILCSGQPLTVHAAAMASQSGQTAQSDDNSLSSLSLSSGQLSPALQAGVTKYTATVPNDVTEVEVSAKTTNANAKITSISGNTNLSEGENLVSIVVTAENGSAATYKITVTRESAAADGAAGGDLNENTAGADDETDVMPIAETGTETAVADGTASVSDGTSDAAYSEEYDALKAKYDSLHEKYGELKKSDQNKIFGLTGACVVLAVICLILFFKKRREPDEDDFFPEDDRDYDSDDDDDYGEEDYEDDSYEEDYENEYDEADEDDEDDSKGTDFVEEKSEESEEAEKEYDEADEYEDSEDYEDMEDYGGTEEYQEPIDDAESGYEDDGEETGYEEEDYGEEDAGEDDYDASYDEEFEEEEFEEKERKTRKKERALKKKHGRRERTEDELEVIDLNDL